MKNKIIGTISLLLVVGLLTGCGCQNKKEKTTSLKMVLLK